VKLHETGSTNALKQLGEQQNTRAGRAMGERAIDWSPQRTDGV